jgi:hypothetical protein
LDAIMISLLLFIRLITNSIEWESLSINI